MSDVSSASGSSGRLPTNLQIIAMVFRSHNDYNMFIVEETWTRDTPIIIDYWLRRENVIQRGGDIDVMPIITHYCIEMSMPSIHAEMDTYTSIDRHVHFFRCNLFFL
jgi:hypothetical protein